MVMHETGAEFIATSKQKYLQARSQSYNVFNKISSYIINYKATDDK